MSVVSIRWDSSVCVDHMRIREQICAKRRMQWSYLPVVILCEKQSKFGVLLYGEAYRVASSKRHCHGAIYVIRCIAVIDVKFVRIPPRPQGMFDDLTVPNWCNKTTWLQSCWKLVGWSIEYLADSLSLDKICGAWRQHCRLLMWCILFQCCEHVLTAWISQALVYHESKKKFLRGSSHVGHSPSEHVSEFPTHSVHTWYFLAVSWNSHNGNSYE